VHAPFAGSGVLKAINNASTLSAALEGAGGDVDGALAAWDAAQIEAAQDSQREARRLTSVLIDDIPDVFTPDVPAGRDWLNRLAPGATWIEAL
jgi:2-polyprenyl-6-methoxyphenol hydroxylase-like FAD-dependent oxidoreductase